jgi:hypothetical protein
LLKLAPHFIDGLVELLYPVVKLGVEAIHLPFSRCNGGLPRLNQAPQLTACLAATVGFGKQPPGQSGSADHGTGDGAGQDDSAIAACAADIVAAIGP